MAIAPLPLYPSSRARAALQPSQLAALHQKVALALQETLELPAEKRDTTRSVAFVSSYVRDTAQELLQSLIWDPESTVKPRKLSGDSKDIRNRVLLLAERLAPSGSFDLSALFDLTVVYSKQPKRLRGLLTAAHQSFSEPRPDLSTSAVPAFASILSQTSDIGLYGLRKSAHTLLCFLRASPPEFIRAFAQSKSFLLVLAHAYDGGLAAIAQSYGGMHLPSDGPQRALDDWERILLETKVALLDTFHILFKTLLADLTRATGTELATESERTFEIVFALLELPSASPSTGSTTPTPFLNRALVVDYQHAYDLSRLLESTLTQAASDDARLEFITSSLRTLDNDSPSSSTPSHTTTPGALTFLLGSGLPPTAGTRAATSSQQQPPPAPPAASSSVRQDDGGVDLRVSEVLAILPDYPPAYVRALLQRPAYSTAERVIEALLEGTAPSPEDVERDARAVPPRDEFEYTRDRENVFDGQKLDLARVHKGKKSDDATTVLRDRSFIDQMKAEILRRAEAVSDSEDEEADLPDMIKGTDSRKGKIVAFEEELDDIDAVRVGGDGEGSGEEDDQEEQADRAGPSGTRSGQATPANPESVLELAYIANPKVFERDGATRRSKDRAALRAQTGWDDQQIEGWSIMLERNPKQKERMLQKHEFSGNIPLETPSSGPSRSQTPEGQSSRGRGRGRGRGGGGGRGRGRGGGGGQGGEQRDRAFKDKNKASRGNHNRKRGHDKKMARAGGPG